MNVKCDQCNGIFANVDMIQVRYPPDDGGRLMEIFCSQTCLLERLQGKVREESKNDKK